MGEEGSGEGVGRSGFFCVKNDYDFCTNDISERRRGRSPTRRAIDDNEPVIDRAIDNKTAMVNNNKQLTTTTTNDDGLCGNERLTCVRGKPDPFSKVKAQDFTLARLNPPNSTAPAPKRVGGDTVVSSPCAKILCGGAWCPHVSQVSGVATLPDNTTAAPVDLATTPDGVGEDPIDAVGVGP